MQNKISKCYQKCIGFILKKLHKNQKKRRYSVPTPTPSWPHLQSPRSRDSACLRDPWCAFPCPIRQQSGRESYLQGQPLAQLLQPRGTTCGSRLTLGLGRMRVLHRAGATMPGPVVGKPRAPTSQVCPLLPRPARNTFQSSQWHKQPTAAWVL